MRMNNKLFVGSLDWKLRDQDLREAFEQFGELEYVRVIMERDNPNRSRGFGYVTFINAEDAQKAMEAMNGQTLGSRPITVTEARPREDRPTGGYAA